MVLGAALFLVHQLASLGGGGLEVLAACGDIPPAPNLVSDILEHPRPNDPVEPPLFRGADDHDLSWR